MPAGAWTPASRGGGGVLVEKKKGGSAIDAAHAPPASPPSPTKTWPPSTLPAPPLCLPHAIDAQLVCEESGTKTISDSAGPHLHAAAAAVAFPVHFVARRAQPAPHRVHKNVIQANDFKKWGRGRLDPARPRGARATPLSAVPPPIFGRPPRRGPPPRAPHFTPQRPANVRRSVWGEGRGAGEAARRSPRGGGDPKPPNCCATPEFSPFFPLSGRVLFAQTSSPFLPPFAACGKRKSPPPPVLWGSGRPKPAPAPPALGGALSTLPQRPAHAGARPRPGSGRGGGAGERGSPADAGPTRSPRPPAPAPST